MYLNTLIKTKYIKRYIVSNKHSCKASQTRGTPFRSGGYGSAAHVIVLIRTVVPNLFALAPTNHL